MALRCMNLTCGYADSQQSAHANGSKVHAVLHDVSFSLERGQVVALIGPSGAGKSTLLAALAGHLKPIEGSMQADGSIGRVIQNPERQLFAETAFDDVAFGPRNQKLEAEVVCKRVESALGAVRLDAKHAQTTSPFAYSGGEQRRLAIAGILAMEPTYLLYDEPTAGLDVNEVGLFWELQRKLANEGRGILVVTHDLAQAALWADSVLVLERGRIVAQGPSAEMVRMYQDVEGSVVVADASIALAEPARNANPQSFENHSKQSFAPQNLPPQRFAFTLDPRTKIIVCLVLLLASVLARGIAGLALVALCAVGVLLVCKVSPRAAAPMVKPLLPLLLCVVIFDGLFTPGGQVLLALGSIAVTTGGLIFAVETTIRFLAALVIAGSLRYCSNSTELSDGFRLLANPLRHFGAPVDDAALALSITFRFMPLLQEELMRIREAQIDRGAQFDEGNIVKRVKAASSLVVPLAMSSFHRAIALAQAMENRSFMPRQQRTCLRRYSLAARDYTCIFASLILFAAILLLSFWL